MRRLEKLEPGTTEYQDTAARLRVVRGKLKKILLFINSGKEEWHAGLVDLLVREILTSFSFLNCDDLIRTILFLFIRVFVYS